MSVKVVIYDDTIFTDEDISAIEFIHDRLADVYKENLNLDYMIRAREVASKMYDLLTKEKKWTIQKHFQVKKLL